MEKPLIAVVEDEVLIALEVGEALKAAGFRVRTAASAHCALRQATEGEKPAGIVADIQLRDGQDGIDLVLGLRALCGSDLAVVFATGYEDDATRSRAEPCRPAAYFSKPVDPKALAEVLWSHLTQRDDAPIPDGVARHQSFDARLNP